MTIEEAIKLLKAMNKMMHRSDGTHVSDVCEALDMAIEALSAVDTVEELDKKLADSVQGEWTYLHGSIGSYMTISCPFCGNTFNDVDEWKYNYCPSCGARMKGGEDK